MPSIQLTPDLAARFICLPGTALIHCSPAELMTESGLLVKPEAAADWERKRMAVRKGVVERVDRGLKGTGIVTRKKTISRVNADDLKVRRGATVYYLGRQDEADDEYVVVKIGQIVAVQTLRKEATT